MWQRVQRAAYHAAAATAATVRVTALLQGSRVDVRQVSRVLQLAPMHGRRSEEWTPLHHDKEWSLTQIRAAPAAFVAVSRRGAVVLINAEIADALLILDAVAAHAAEGATSAASLLPLSATTSLQHGPLATAVDSLHMEVRPQLQGEESGAVSGTLTVKRLDVDTLRTIASTLEQSILLQRLEQRTDALYVQVKRLIEDVAVASFTDRRSIATRVMLTANALLGEVLLTNVTLRPGMPAWSQPPLERLYDALQVELELHTRVEELQRRLNFVTEVARVCLAGRKDGHLRRLEWMIVFILTLEVLVKLTEMRRGRPPQKLHTD